MCSFLEEMGLAMEMCLPQTRMASLHLFVMMGGMIMMLLLSAGRVFLYGDLLAWRSVTAPMNSGSYQDCPTELYFEDGHPTYKLKFSGAVLVASWVHVSLVDLQVRKISIQKDSTETLHNTLDYELSIKYGTWKIYNTPKNFRPICTTLKFWFLTPGSKNIHCYKYRLIKSGSGVFLASHLLEQDLNRVIEHLQEQELKENEYTKKNAGTSIEINSILVPA